ncbi:MAG TPA: hypothetical protein VGZ48_10210 [Candidatus Acidoferrales bacterium]|jgi:hypothetical protein|nr:hypothetical protein [Candidatus Acidoferrales bacterium]
MPFSARSTASQFVWNFVFGPFLSFFPKRLRDKWFAHHQIAWRPATIISGILQFFLAPFLLLFWSATEVCSLGQFLGFGCASAGLTQAFSLILAALNPITWLMVYLIFEGFGRAFAAAMMGETPGTLVFLAPDLLYRYITKNRGKSSPELADLVTQDDLRADWQLKIESAQPKHDWQAGNLLSYGGHYYRIEGSVESGGPRPSVYLLRRLPAGVSSRSVIVYSPLEAAGQVR